MSIIRTNGQFEGSVKETLSEDSAEEAAKKIDSAVGGIDRKSVV